MRTDEEVGDQWEQDEEWVLGWDSGYAERIEQRRLLAPTAVPQASVPLDLNAVGWEHVSVPVDASSPVLVLEAL